MEEIEETEEVEFPSELLLFVESIGKPVKPEDSSFVPGKIDKLRRDYAEVEQRQPDFQRSLEQNIEVLEEMFQSSRQGTSRKYVCPSGLIQCLR